MKRLTLGALTALLLPFAAIAQDEQATEPGFNEDTFKGLEMRGIGPALMSGRISDIVVDPTDQSTWYVAVGSGGIWKTESAGTTWTPIFDDEASYSIGSLTLDPGNPNTIWVGTGENVSGRHVAYGSGVYRSRDGGQTWENKGLPDSERIGMIRVDPRDSNVIFVAAQGPLWSAGGERGLYKSTDGGDSWRKVLGDGLGNDEEDDAYTGVSEVHMDPRNPDVMYAVSWQRFRNVAVLMDGGPGSGIHKSVDGGETWRELTEGLPADNSKGKIGLAISPQQPDVVYATIELGNREGGFWRSADGGESWEKKNDYLSGGTGPHYYQEIFASPHQFDRVYQMDVRLHVTEDGGDTFEEMKADTKHVDHHAMAFDPNDPDYLLVGNDGGVYESFDLGKTWRYMANLPVTQFYKISVDYEEPFYNVYSGAQDNSSLGGPHRTDNNVGIRNSDWYLTLWADGHQSMADPTNPNIIYANWQEGNLGRFDRATGEAVYIQPQPGAGESEERFNWDAPILISPHDAETLYFASYRVWKSENRGDAWEAISDDLTRDQDRTQQPVMGRTWSADAAWDLSAMSKYNTITSLSESPLVEGLIYAGTDDGLIQVSEDGGANWRRIDSLPGVPDYFFVNDIKADLHDPDTVYVVVDDHKSGDFAPYVLKSENRGRRWQSISSNLPDDHLLWRIVQDHEKPGLLFLGTEFGVYFTVDGGGRWTKLAGGAPNIAFRDLAIQTRENDLVGATFGRGIYILDDYSALRDVNADMLASDATLFPVRRAHWYIPRRPHACVQVGCVDSQGDAYYVAPNPDYGAVFTYYLPDALRSAKDARREDEKALEMANEDVRFADWATLNEEAAESEPAIVFTVTDLDGNVIRHIEGSTKAGFQRVAWDLRYPQLKPFVPESERSPNDSSAGVLVAPGRYRVTMQQRLDGAFTALGESREFDVVSIREPTIEGTSQDERLAFRRSIDELDAAVRGTLEAIDEASTELEAIQDVIGRSTADASLYSQADAIRQQLAAERARISGDPVRGRYSEDRPMPITARLSKSNMSPHWNAHGPTTTHRESLQIARNEFNAVQASLRQLIDVEYANLKTALDQANVPWSPGRGLP